MRKAFSTKIEVASIKFKKKITKKILIIKFTKLKNNTN
jgi:hypothetical protein